MSTAIVFLNPDVITPPSFIAGRLPAAVSGSLTFRDEALEALQHLCDSLGAQLVIMAPDDAAAWAANSEVESRNNPAAKQIGGGPGRGKYQWGANNPKFDRRIPFRRMYGKDVEAASDAEQDRYRIWELANTERRAAAHIRAAQGAGDKAAAISTYYERPKDIVGNAALRSAIAQEILHQVQINIAVNQHGQVTGANAHTTRGARAMISVAPAAK